jgi:capsule polysaccharide export protein KpsE/RkpR
MAEFFTQRAVMQRLGLHDYRTLKRWCREINPQIEPRKREGYGHTVWYTKTQVSKLERVAEIHGRQIQEPGEGEGEETHLQETNAGLLSSLQEQVTQLQAQLAGVLEDGELSPQLVEFIRAEVERQLQQQLPQLFAQLKGAGRVRDIRLSEANENR